MCVHVCGVCVGVGGRCVCVCVCVCVNVCVNVCVKDGGNWTMKDNSWVIELDI